MQYSLVKINRGEYNLIDTEGNLLFPYPKSKWDANQMRQNFEVFERMLTHEGIVKSVQKFIHNQQWEVSHYGSIEQIIRNYARELWHTDMRKMMQKPSLFYAHLLQEHAKNQEARKQYLIDNSMETNQIKPMTADQELASKAAPLAEYLKEHHHPHTSAIVTSQGVEIVEGVKNIPNVFATLGEYYKP